MLSVFLWAVMFLTASPERRPALTAGDLIGQRLLFPVSEAAGLLGVHRTTLYDYVRQGRLELVRSGGRTFVTQAELTRFMHQELEPVQVSPRRTA